MRWLAGWLVPALLAPALLGGCAGRLAEEAPPAAVDASLLASWERHRQSLADIAAFRIQGRLSSGMLGSARLSWRQQGERFSARASGPFGAGALAIGGTPEAVRIRHGREDVVTDTPEAWMQQRLGWSLPVAGLRYWVLGLPRPGQHARYAFDDEGRLQWLAQDGWQLRFLRYGEEPPRLPKRIALQPPPGAGDEVLLRIDRWAEVSGTRDGPTAPRLAEPGPLER